MWFGNGNQASLSEARSGDAVVLSAAGPEPPAKGRPVIVVGGGADDLADGALDRAGAIIGAAVASAAEVTGAVLVDGDTSAGVMRLTGQARARWPALPVLVGVAPAGRRPTPGARRGRVCRWRKTTRISSSPTATSGAARQARRCPWPRRWPGMATSSWCWPAAGRAPGPKFWKSSAPPLAGFRCLKNGRPSRRGARAVDDLPDSAPPPGRADPAPHVEVPPTAAAFLHHRP